MTTRGEISDWFDRGVVDGKRFMLVICDTYDHDDYPVYFDREPEAKLKMNSPGEMQRFMEAYDLHGSKEDQLNERRANCFRMGE